MISFFVIAIVVLYLFVIGLLSIAFDKVEDFKMQDLKPKTKFSIVVPFRNEAKNLTDLIHSILNLNYPKSLFEVIFIDDESEDTSVDIINTCIGTKSSNRIDIDASMISNQRTSNSPKKDAISAAIKQAKHEWIITTDADCVLPKYWLDAFDECIQTQNLHCIVAPVTYSKNVSFFKRFQTLDFLSLQGATIGGFGLNKPFMCNGANFGYKKSAFKSVNGFEGNKAIASGDDIFLLEKLLQLNSKKVYYLKSQKAIVKTKPVSTFSDLIQQRLRWAAKTSRYNNWFAKCIGLIVLLGNLTVITIIPLTLFNLVSMRITIALIVIKFSIDFLLLFKTTRFFRQETLLITYLAACFIYPFFSVYVALLSLFKSYEWKDRTFKK